MRIRVEPDEQPGLSVTAATRILDESGVNVSDVETTDPIDQFLAFAYDGDWYDGTNESIQTRHAGLNKWHHHFSAVLASPTVGSVELQEFPEFLAEIDRQKSLVDGMMFDLQIADRVGHLEDEDDHIVATATYDIGEDDGTPLYKAAAALRDEVDGFDWERFATVGAQEWLIDQSDLLLVDEELRYDAALEYVAEKTAVLNDNGRRQRVIDRFMTIAAPYDVPQTPPADPTQVNPGTCPACGMPNGAHAAGCMMGNSAQAPAMPMVGKVAAPPVTPPDADRPLPPGNSAPTGDTPPPPPDGGAGPDDTGTGDDSDAAPDADASVPIDKDADPAVVDDAMGGDITDMQIMPEQPPTLDEALGNATDAMDQLTQVQQQLQQLVGRRKIDVALQKAAKRRKIAAARQATPRVAVDRCKKCGEQDAIGKYNVKGYPGGPHPLCADCKKNVEGREGIESRRAKAPERVRWVRDGNVERIAKVTADRRLQRQAAPQRLVSNQEYRVIAPGAYLSVASGDGAGGGVTWSFNNEALEPGDVIKYEGHEKVPGSGSVAVDIFSKGGKKGAFEPNSWGAADLSFIEPVRDRVDISAQVVAGGAGGSTSTVVGGGAGGTVYSNGTTSYNTSTATTATNTNVTFVAQPESDDAAFGAGRRDGQLVAQAWKAGELVPEYGDQSDVYHQGFEQGLRDAMARREIPIRAAWRHANRKTGRKAA